MGSLGTVWAFFGGCWGGHLGGSLGGSLGSLLVWFNSMIINKLYIFLVKNPLSSFKFYYYKATKSILLCLCLVLVAQGVERNPGPVTSNVFQDETISTSTYSVLVCRAFLQLHIKVGKSFVK
jgi:hypothetical protein